MPQSLEMTCVQQCHEHGHSPSQNCMCSAIAELCFSADELPLKGERTVIVGKTFLEQMPIPQGADQIVCGKHTVYLSGSYIWSPYLDYRQFPNALIEALKTRLKVSS